MKKKGFTLVELLGVITILGIVLGLAVVGYVSVRNHAKTTYYKALEESVMIAGVDYYNYNKDQQPEMYGDLTNVNISELITNKYIEEVKSQNGESCGGYVGAYKKISDKVNYYVCLECPDYETNTNECNGIVDYDEEIQIPNNSLCKTLTYNGEEQELIKNTEITGYTLENHLGTDAGNYTVTAKLLTGYKWTDKTTKDKTFVCNIKKANPTITLSETEGTVVKNGKIDFTESADVNGKFKNVSSSATVSPATSATEIEANHEETVELSARDTGTSKITITFTPTDTKNYNTVSATYNLTVTDGVTKPTAASHCKNPTAIYTGSEQTITKSSGTGYTFSGNKQTNAGTYTVTAALAPNYMWSDGTSDDVKFQCSIAKAPATITLSSSEGTIVVGGTMNFNAKSVASGTWTTSSNKTTTATPTFAATNTTSSGTIANNTWTNVKVYGVPNGGGNDATITVTINPTDTNNYTSASKTWTAHIIKAATKPTNSLCVARTYTGDPQNLTSVTSGTGYNLSNFRQTNAGTYTITASLASGYRWSDNSTGNVTFTCSMGSKSLTIPTSPSAKTYTGNSQSSGITCPSGSSPSGTQSATNAGSYTQTCSLSSTTNYKWSDGSTSAKSIGWRINKATPTISLSSTSGTAVVGNNLTFTATTKSGSSKSVSGTLNISSSSTTIATVSPTSKSISATTSGVGTTETVAGKSAGSATITVNFTPSDTTNYNSATAKTYAATITSKATIPTTALCKSGLVYTGNAQTLTTATSGTGYTLSGYSQTNAGSHTITATLTSGYRWSDNTTANKTFKCSIAKATPIITLSPTSGTVVVGDNLTFTATTKSGSSKSVDGTLKISSSSTTIATVSPTSKSISATTSGVATTGTVTGKSAGSATITVNFTPSDTTNYNSATAKTYAATIASKATIPTTSLCKTGLVYNGRAQTLTTATSGTGYTLSGYSQTNAGSHTITATLTSGYRWSDGTTGTKTFTCSIAKLKDTFTMTAAEVVYDGQRHGATFTTTSGNQPTVTYYSDNSCETAISGRPKNVGVYYAKASSADTDNYISASMGCRKAVTIYLEATIPTIALCKTGLEYTGKQQTLTTTTSGTGYKLSGYSQTNAGSHTITATLNENYRWSDNTTANKTFKCSIAKAKDTFTMTPVTVVYDGERHGATFTTVSGSQPTVTYYSDSSCETAISGSPRGSSNETKIYYAKASTAETENYKSASMSCRKAVTIIKPSVELEISGISNNKVTVTCKSGNASDPISSFVVAGTRVSVPNNSATITYEYDFGSCNSGTYTGNKVSITAVCKSTYGAEDSKTSSEYICARNSVCGNGTTNTTYSGYCSCYFTGGNVQVKCSSYSLGSSSACESRCKREYGNNYLSHTSSCSSSSSTTYPYCWH